MKNLSNLSQNAHWLLRIALASVFIYHGVPKLINLSGTAEMLGLPVFILLLVALAETIGGAMVLIGGFRKDWITRIGAAMLIPVLLGAIFMVHWGQWTFVPSETHPMGGMEFQVVLLLTSIYLLIKGADSKLEMNE